MQQRRHPLSNATGFLSAIALACALLSATPRLTAQTPITTLPAPGGTTPQTNTPAADTTPAPASNVHPITSLPKPPTAYTPPPPTPPSADIPAPQPLPATTPAPTPPPAPTAPPVVVTTSTTPPPQPVPVLDNAPLRASILPDAPTPPRQHPARSYRPFTAFALGVKGGFAGIGVEAAVPLWMHFNLRASASFFSYSGSYNADGITINGEAKFRSGTASIDYYPFAHHGFRISPGVTFYNGNNLNATAFVPPGNEFDLNDTNYYSAALPSPVSGSASLTFGKRVAPSLTIGVGNMIPRSGGRFSFPFEIGVQYIGVPPQMNIFLTGYACTTQPGSQNFDPFTCGNVQTDSTTQANLQQEENDINSDIKFLRFYPIISQGFAVRF